MEGTKLARPGSLFSWERTEFSVNLVWIKS